MNVHESEKLAAFLHEAGYVPLPESAEKEKYPDILIYNTCAIREGAEDRTFSNIGALLKKKRENPDMIIAVCGCMPQKKESFEIFKNRFPFVDIVFGTHNFDDFPELLKRFLADRKRVLEIEERERPIEEGREYLRDDTDQAYVNIMYGCDNFCTYCIVPYVRGRERSRAPEGIVAEIKNLAKRGYKKITLLGQNVNSYKSRDEIGKEFGFSELLKEIDCIDGDFTVTFMTSHPKDLSREVIDILASSDRFIKQIHLPVQSGSDKVLSRMNRRYTRGQYLDLIDYIRLKIPDCDITSDIIVGFPGETDEDYEATLSLVREVNFNNLFMFMYSAREGTAAAGYEGQIAENIKKERLYKLISIQRAIQAGSGVKSDTLQEPAV